MASRSIKLRWFCEVPIAIANLAAFGTKSHRSKEDHKSYGIQTRMENSDYHVAIYDVHNDLAEAGQAFHFLLPS